MKVEKFLNTNSNPKPEFLRQPRSVCQAEDSEERKYLFRGGNLTIQTTNMQLRKEYNMNVNQKTKQEIHINYLVTHLIGWSKSNQASITQAIDGLGLGTLTKKTTSSLNAITAAFAPEILVVATKLLAEVEEAHGAIADVLEAAQVIRTRKGYVLQPVFVEGSV